MSSPSASPPSSTSSTLTEERSTRTMADVVKNLDTEELINYLWKKNLKLKESHFKIFRKKEITGSAFLDRTEDRFRRIGLALGPAMALAKFIEGRDQKLRSFSSYKTLEELKDVLRKYKVNGEDIMSIKQFNPEPLNNTNANEATRCVFITSILNAFLSIVRRIINEEKIYISYQKAVSGEEASERVDYAIKENEDLMCIAEGKPRNVEIGYLQNIMQLEGAYHTNKKKRTADEAFRDDDYDYFYGIVSTGIHIL
ncbi:3489_t:CDS:2 [Paraglomus occultum]|uniref:3489_t:CDS:1 n=1 Tax=Paraglomus occultum TaxID=144539 RepID=A0A9N8WNN2_9GLOM|nr:3489_t:CDS:2 [Paraglomus occultum]